MYTWIYNITSRLLSPSSCIFYVHRWQNQCTLYLIILLLVHLLLKFQSNQICDKCNNFIASIYPECDRCVPEHESYTNIWNSYSVVVILSELIYSQLLWQITVIQFVIYDIQVQSILKMCNMLRLFHVFKQLTSLYWVLYCYIYIVIYSAYRLIPLLNFKSVTRLSITKDKVILSFLFMGFSFFLIRKITYKIQITFDTKEEISMVQCITI